MKQNNSLAIIVVIMALVSFLCLSLSVSYSYIISSISSADVQTIFTSNLNAQISFADVSLETSPMTDAAGLAQTSYGLIEITKDNLYSVYYTINLLYDTASLPSGVTTSDLLPLENLKVALFEINGGTVASEPIVGPVRIGDLPIANYDVNDNYQTSYLLASGTFASGSDTASYALKVWLSEDTTDTYEGYAVYIGANVVQEPLISKNNFNLSGTITLDGTVASGATLEIQNGLYSSVTDASGNFAISSIISGTYNLSVTYNGNTYETVIHLKDSTTSEVQTISESSVSAGTNLQQAAYTYYSTPWKIMQANSFDNTFAVPASAYSIPASYIITGLSAIGSVDIPSFNININSTTGLLEISRSA